MMPLLSRTKDCCKFERCLHKPQDIDLRLPISHHHEKRTQSATVRTNRRKQATAYDVMDLEFGQAAVEMLTLIVRFVEYLLNIFIN